MIYILLFLTIKLNAQNMKLNFGANEQITRIELGYYSNPININPTCYGYFGDSESGMLSNSQFSLMNMYMINNRNLEKDEPMSRPRFIINKLDYNDFSKQLTYSISYGQLTECNYSILGIKKLIGYWSVGVANFKNPTVGFGGYNKNLGIQSNIIYNLNKSNGETLFKTPNKMDISVLIYKQIYKNILINGGIDRNNPRVGMGFMFKIFRINPSFILYKGKPQFGLSFTANI